MKPNEQSVAEGIFFTDHYQLTMAQLYFRMGIHEKAARFEHFFRSYPDYGQHKAGYCINAGLEWLLDWMDQVRFGDVEIEYLKSLKSGTGRRIFEDDFLKWLRSMDGFESLSMWAVPEGRVVHPNVPLTVVEGPLAVAQLLETSLLNHLNFQILIASKAARIKESARGRPVLEFGLRRAHSRGASAGARAALIGGADFTSNVGMSYTTGYMPKGTHGHSMIQAFMALGDGELGAFQAYADLYPDDCLLLVDTINTLESGVPNAITVFEKLRRKGHKPVGIRLDSGDLAYLSIHAAKQFNDAGFPDTAIVLSNDLDELVIWQILTQIQDEAGRYGVDPEKLINRLVFGVGTRLITSSGDSALGGVYKLVALSEKEDWIPAIKISESPGKTVSPGNKRIWRVYDDRGKATADLMSDEDEDPRTMDVITMRHHTHPAKIRSLKKADISEIEPLLVPIRESGRMLYTPVPIDDLRKVRINDLNRLDVGVKRIISPHIYHVSLTQKMWELKQSLVRAARVGT